MCGICGFWTTAAQAEQPMISEMCRRLAHRGPDSNGIWVDAAAGVALGHQRLAIIDLSLTGHQPMTSANERYVITFNGEIYNYQIVRAELAALGHQFRGTSDTEVMLAAFCQWGVEPSLKKLVGMFAFGLWDRYERALYLARDRMGEKPLYYGWCGSTFAFGSELKAICAVSGWQAEIDRDVLALYFRYNYVPTPYSIYRGIYKLLPGTWLRLQADQAQPGKLPESTAYWSLRDIAVAGVEKPFDGSDRDAIAQLDRLLRTAVAGQMLADVPLGAFLSGGVDSSTIVALMQAQSSRPVKTFTIGFDDVAYNEAVYAVAIAQHLGTDHTELYVTSRDALDVVPRLPTLYDEPFADSSQIPTFLVAQLARQHVTVSLSGDGGDEVFCGYNRHVQLDRLWSKFRVVPRPVREIVAIGLKAIPSAWLEAMLRQRKSGVLADQIQKTAGILPLRDPEQMYLQLTYSWDQPTQLVVNAHEPNTIQQDRAHWPTLPNYLERLLYIESVTSLPDDMLVKVDRAAMGVSLETRVPLLDYRVVEFAWRLPLSMKLRSGMSKWILRQILYQYVPSALIDRPKSGFSMPIDEWLKGPLRDWAESLLNSSRLRQTGYLNTDLVRTRWAEQLSGRRKWQSQLWGILMFQAWLECWQSGNQV